MFADSDAYERFMGRWSRQLAPAFIRFAQVEDGDRVLDLGCGTGALSYALARVGPSVRVTGVDASSEYVRHADTHKPDDRIQFAIADARALEFSDDSFDRTLSMLVLTFIPDAVEAVREMMRVTRAGGTVAAAVWDYGGGMEMLRAFWDEAVAHDPSIAARDERNLPLCRPGELGAFWRSAGLRQVEEQPLAIDLRFASFDDYWTPFLGHQGPAGAYVAAITDGQRAALAARLQDRLIGSPRQQPITLRARAWAVRGIVPPR
jgi:SAM-dependent methyltransferase